MEVVVSYARSCDLRATAGYVLQALVRLGKDDIVLCRANKNTDTDFMVPLLAEGLGIPCVMYSTRTGEKAFDRDFRMVHSADKVIAFFTEDAPMHGGTGHVVEVALRMEKPVEAYAISEAGELRSVGEA
jgi:hypothetical protein